MEHDSADDFELAGLRDRAREHGRTDVIGRLDRHAGTAAFQQSPQWINVVRLAALLPRGTRSPRRTRPNVNGCGRTPAR